MRKALKRIDRTSRGRIVYTCAICPRSRDISEFESDSIFIRWFHTLVSCSIGIPEGSLTIFQAAPPFTVVSSTDFEHVKAFTVPQSLAVLADVDVAIRQQSLPVPVSLASIVSLTLVLL